MTGRGGDDDRGRGPSAARPSPVTCRPLRLPDPPLSDRVAGIALRPWRPAPGDVAALVAAWSDPEIAARTRVPDDRSPAAAARWIRGEPARRGAGLCLDLVVAPLQGGGTAGDAVLGEVGLRNVQARPGRAEVGWWIAPAARGRGLATAAVDLLAGWALAVLGLDQVWARVGHGNPAAARVAAGAGFARLGDAAGATVWSRVRGTEP
ncbi:MAG TPA: GNAT family N-acetyltransferase [Acidimicrobiales bacterium]